MQKMSCYSINNCHNYSAFCLLLSIFIKDRKSLNFTLTAGFLINAIICYFSLVIGYCLEIFYGDEILDTIGCKTIGFIVHHTFMGFFFWTNAMAFNIAKTFSSFKNSRGSQRLGYKTLTFYLLYAEGIPVVITITTVLLDLYGPCDAVLPNMGKVQCFFGVEHNSVMSFFVTSEFLYHYLLICVISFINFICFLVTGISLIKHWYQMRNIKTSSNEGIIQQFWIVLKLSIIMGLPWLLDMISAWAKFDFGFEHTFVLRLCLDIINLFTGFLIFLVLVGINPVLKKLKESSFKSLSTLSTR